MAYTDDVDFLSMIRHKDITKVIKILKIVNYKKKKKANWELFGYLY